jgi:hypothetical protein
MVIEHTSLVATCALGFLWLALRYRESGAARHLYGIALVYALALHAHPSTYGLALVGAPLIWRRWQSSAGRWRELGIAGFLFLLPFLPFIAVQDFGGSPDRRATADYFSGAGSLGKLSHLPDLLHGLFVTGPQYIGGSVLRLDGRWADAYAIFLGVLWAVVLAGLVSSLAARSTRRAATTGIAIVVAVGLSVLFIRAYTPYYMSFVVLTLLLGLAAFGLRAAIALPGFRHLAHAVIAGAALLPVVVSIGAARTFSEGSLPFAAFPLFDVKRPYVEGPPLPFVPAHAVRTVGKALCSSPAVVAHGALAFHMLHDYALDARLRCDSSTLVRLGGREPADATHIAGLSTRLLRDAQVDPARADSFAKAGPLSLFRVTQILNPASGEGLSKPGTYPPAPFTFGPAKTLSLQFDARCDEMVVVTNMYHAGFAPDPTVVAAIDGKAVQPAAADALSKVYACRDGAPDAHVSWSLQVTVSAPERVDVVTVIPTKKQ